MNLKTKLTVLVIASLVILSTSISVISIYKSNEGLEEKALKQLNSIRASKQTHVNDYFNLLNNLLVSTSSSNTSVQALNDFDYSFNNFSTDLSFEMKDIKAKLSTHYENNYINEINFNLPNIESKKPTSEYLPKSDNGIISQYVMIVDNENKIGEKNKLLLHENYDGLYLENHETHHRGFNKIAQEFGLYDIFLVNNKGTIVYSVYKRKDYGTNLISGPYKDSSIAKVFKNAINLEKGKSVFEDYRPYEPSLNTPASFIASAIYDGDIKIGALIFKMPTAKIDEIMSFDGKYEQSGLGKTGEAYLVGSDFKMKNNSRFLNKISDKYVKENKSTIGLFTIKNKLVEDALKGKSGTKHTLNYLNEDVIMTYAPIKVFDKTWAIVAEINVDEAQKAAVDLRNLVILASILILLLVVIFIYMFINNSFIKPLNNFQNGLSNFFRYLNKETNEVQLLEIKTNDEIGMMAKVVNDNIEKTKHLIDDDNKFIDEVQKMIFEVNKGFLSNRFENRVQSENLEKLRISFNEMLDSLEKNIGKDTNKILNLLNEFAELNFTNSIKDDNGKLVIALNDFSKLITQMLVESKSNGLTLQNSSDLLLQNVNTLNINSNETAASLEETAASLEEITSITRSNTQNVAKMANYANALISSAKEGESLASKTTKAMDEINEQVSAINDSIGIIDQIAFQTNILSLNAAVEAATAGEAGKGFAVVAQEVRNLASRSAEAAKDIKDLVENANLKANEGKTISDSMITGYTTLNENISNTIGLINNVETASKEQLNGIEQINDAVTKLDERTQQNVGIANNTQEIAKQTDVMATFIVEDANKKEFIGKDEVQAKKLDN